MRAIKNILEPTNTHKKESQYQGVSWNVQAQKWKSSVSENSIKYECGYFNTDREAVVARDRKILALGLSKKLQILKKK